MSLSKLGGQDAQLHEQKRPLWRSWESQAWFHSSGDWRKHGREISWSWKESIQLRVAQQTDAEQRRQAVCANYIGWEHQEEPMLAFLETQVLYPFQYMLILFNFPKNVASIRNKYYPCHSTIDEEIEVHKREVMCPRLHSQWWGRRRGMWEFDGPAAWLYFLFS